MRFINELSDDYIHKAVGVVGKVFEHPYKVHSLVQSTEAYGVTMKIVWTLLIY